MPAGLQIFNADGSLQFDTTKRVMRFLTVVATGTSNGSATVSGLNQGTPIAVVGTGSESNNNSPNVTFSGDTVSWDWGSIPVGSRTNNNINVMVY
jgi:hypothetical protein